MPQPVERDTEHQGLRTLQVPTRRPGQGAGSQWEPDTTHPTLPRAHDARPGTGPTLLPGRHGLRLAAAAAAGDGAASGHDGHQGLFLLRADRLHALPRHPHALRGRGGLLHGPRGGPGCGACHQQRLRACPQLWPRGACELHGPHLHPHHHLLLRPPVQPRPKPHGPPDGDSHRQPGAGPAAAPTPAVIPGLGLVSPHLIPSPH
uniref:Sperm acrosome membrane-associated protein 4 n=1 Tax=Heterocephalus glaber TaxID=10181 RepID=A0A0P6IZS9_HETGA